MKKRILIGITILSVIVITIFNLNLSLKNKNDLSLLCLDNVEALAGETESSSCVTTVHYNKELGDQYLKSYLYCGHSCSPNRKVQGHKTDGSC